MLEEYIHTLTPAEAKTLDSMTTTDAHARGSIFIEQFAYPTGVYILTQGKARLYQLTTIAKTLCALQMGSVNSPVDFTSHVISPENHVLCESSIILNQINTFTAVAESDIELIFISLETLAKLKEKHPNIALKVYEFLAHVAASRCLHLQENFLNRVIGHATNPHSALAMLKKYVGNTQVCTPQIAYKLFKIDSPVIPEARDASRPFSRIKHAV